MPTEIEFKRRKNAFLLFSILVVLVVTLVPGNGKVAGNQLDKLVHWGIFFLLGMSILYRYNKDKKLTTFLLLAVLGGLFTEVAQQYIPGRGMDIYDGIADTIGIITAYFVYPQKD